MDTYKDAIFIDGLVISKFSRAVFEDMKKGGITAANCTCSVWHNFQDTMSNIAQWKYWFREWDDILIQVHDVKDIEQAKACLLYTSPSPRDATLSRMPSSA